MAWTELGATPGSATTYYYDPSMQYADASAFEYNPNNLIVGLTVGQLTNPIYGIPLAGDPSGELEFTGGGGGSTRPSSGFLYPRGY